MPSHEYHTEQTLMMNKTRNITLSTNPYFYFCTVRVQTQWSQWHFKIHCRRTWKQRMRNMKIVNKVHFLQHKLIH